MTLDEVKKLKADTEKSIKLLILDFQSQTYLPVTDITLVYENGGKVNHSLVQVKIEVTIP